MRFFAYDNGSGIEDVFVGKDVDDVVNTMREDFVGIVDDDWQDLVACEEARPDDEAAWKSTQLAEQLAAFRAALVPVVPTKADLSELVICDERYLG